MTALEQNYPDDLFNNYPTDEEIEKIKTWSISTREDCKALIEYVRTLWNWGDTFITVEGSLYKMATGGWSGNEEIIGALQDNHIFWLLCWKMSTRGGYYEFEIVEAI